MKKKVTSSQTSGLKRHLGVVTPSEAPTPRGQDKEASAALVDQPTVTIADGPQVVFAPREGLDFLQGLEEAFLALVLDHPEAWCSDDTSLRDFLSPFDISRAKGAGSRPGYYVFRFGTLGERGRASLTGGQPKIKWTEIEEKGEDHRGQIIARTKRHFRVDISEVFDRPLPEILLYISRGMGESGRIEMTSGGRVSRAMTRYMENPRRVVGCYVYHSPAFDFSLTRYYSGLCNVSYRPRHVDKDTQGAGSTKKSKKTGCYPRRGGGPYRKLYSQTSFDDVGKKIDEWLRQRGDLPLLPLPG